MKKHAKQAKNHKVNLFGKTVPTLALILVLAGGTAASGALLTSFGSADGTVDVENQAIQVDGVTGEADLLQEEGTVDVETSGDHESYSNYIENHQHYNIELELVNKDGDVSSKDSVEDYLYLATTIEEEEADVAVNTVTTDEGYETGFHITGEADSDSHALFGGVLYAVENFDSVKDSNLDDATVAPEFIEGENHHTGEDTEDDDSFNSPDWVGVVFEDEDGDEYTYVSVTNDGQSGDDYIISDGVTFVLNSEGKSYDTENDEFNEDKTHSVTVTDIEEVSGDLDVQAVKLATGTSDDVHEDAELDLLFQEATLEIDGSDELIGTPQEGLDNAATFNVPSTEEDDYVGFEMGIGIETTEQFDTEEDVGFDYKLSLATE